MDFASAVGIATPLRRFLLQRRQRAVSRPSSRTRGINSPLAARLFRELAFRLGVNLVMYAMCLDYKDDAVHIKSILKKRQ